MYFIRKDEINIKRTHTKKYKFYTYYRCLMDVFNHFKLNNIYQLLTSKENDIINYIETKYNKNNTSTIKTKLCCIYKCYKILNLESNSFKKKIDEYKLKLVFN